MHRMALAFIAATLALGLFPGVASAESNSLGMNMVAIRGGSFIMGEPGAAPANFSQRAAWMRHDFDEWPARRVTLSSFLISAGEVTVEQYRKFKPDYAGPGLNGTATGMSWNEAVAFCSWLSEREGKPYRLPTEAEWEYAARAGTRGPYWSGRRPPRRDINPWRLEGMASGAREWCLDWYGEYPLTDETDPVGAASGLTKVVRGGWLDKTNSKLWFLHASRLPFYFRSANRAAMPPSYAVSGEAAVGPATPLIGFRVVQAPMPATAPTPVIPPFWSVALRPSAEQLRQGPDPAKPWYRRRPLLPVPLDNSGRREVYAAGFDPLFKNHNHSPSLEVLPNGDLLAVYYTSQHEYEPAVLLMACRLRLGALEWDPPEPFINLVDVNDHAPLLFTDGVRVHLFWGSPMLTSGHPFQWMTSEDSGASWGPIKYPAFDGLVGPHSRQPVNTAFRDGGTVYVASDAEGPTSVLWASDDEGKNWRDTGGRSAGRHTAYALLKNGCILGMGGKNTDIGGFMPQAMSCDGGKTWTASKTPFAAMSTNQRPSLVRLRSGRLFFAGDFHDKNANYRRPPGESRRGAYVALSDDDGETWRIKPLPGALPHETDRRDPTLGYSVARQAANGIIHLITSMNTPCLHFELNEAWILSDTGMMVEPADPFEGALPAADSALPLVPDRFGRLLLHGQVSGPSADGSARWEATFDRGRRIGRESFGLGARLVWTRDDGGDGTRIWTRYWPDGQIKSVSTWRGAVADGPAHRFDPGGRSAGDYIFRSGELTGFPAPDPLFMPPGL